MQKRETWKDGQKLGDGPFPSPGDATVRNKKSHKCMLVFDCRRCARLYRCECQRLMGKCDAVLVNMYTTVKSAKQTPKPTHESSRFHMNPCYHTASLSLTLT